MGSAAETATNKFARETLSVLTAGSPPSPSELELVTGNSGQEKLHVLKLLSAVFSERVLFPRPVPFEEFLFNPMPLWLCGSRTPFGMFSVLRGSSFPLGCTREWI